jgi:hypothetical protein
VKYDSDEYRAFRQMKIEAGKLIDPKTAEAHWHYGETLDPYGVLDEVAQSQIGREHFLRAPGSDAWVSTIDLPKDKCEEFWRLADAGHYDSADDAELPF